ncbi:MAG: hypothetical protein A3F84_15970 [Candidatus Handelsmanbacteria bacterium RIFCSPLOWO2_12_FULL_64_10]|uniref:DUF3352 domain-containing protein n=1 Tax=Handelsmanbacteria sp. (strain RIFCSPLOWO2_12_FULL_64_10) TaxID=1817868 RepID=A0A1F6CKV4_HANXR|nr:MAG: hypothetical protein A3F84_15970 [Candidatus Handelsmanbacteria bacterium RIFCSPLOWO2_12_FULL_64_10]
MKRIAWIALIFVFAAGAAPAAFAPVAAQEEEPLARFVPRDLDLFVSIRNPDHFVNSLRDGKLGEPLRALGLGDLLRDLPAGDARAELAFAIESPGEDWLPRLYVLVQSEGAGFDDRVGEKIDEMIAGAETYGLTYDLESYDAFTAYVFSIAGIELGAVVTSGDRMAIAVGEGADTIFDLFGEASERHSFAGTGAFKQLHKAAEAGDAELMTYVRARPVLEAIRTALSAQQLLGEPGALETAFMWLMELPGIDLLEGAGVSLKLSADDELDGAFTVQLGENR